MLGKLANMASTVTGAAKADQKKLAAAAIQARGVAYKFTEAAGHAQAAFDSVGHAMGALQSAGQRAGDLMARTAQLFGAKTESAISHTEGAVGNVGSDATTDAASAVHTADGAAGAAAHRVGDAANFALGGTRRRRGGMCGCRTKRKFGRKRKSKRRKPNRKRNR